MKKILFIFTPLILSSCSSLNLQRVNGVHRMSLKQDQYEKPTFFMGDKVKEILNKKQAGRSIASVEQSDEYEHLSNRQVYFLNTYYQYEVMTKMLKKPNQVKSCPAFHDVLLKNGKHVDEQISLKNHDFSEVKENPENLVFYPILATPYDSSQDLYSVLVQENWGNQQEHTKKALDFFHNKNLVEVRELCDTGVSDGYFIYENLVTYFKSDRTLHGTSRGVEALLKVPVVASLFITDSAHTDNKWARSSDLTQSLLGRVNGQWFSQFREKIRHGHSKILSARLTKTEWK